MGLPRWGRQDERCLQEEIQGPEQIALAKSFGWGVGGGLQKMVKGGTALRRFMRRRRLQLVSASSPFGLPRALSICNDMRPFDRYESSLAGGMGPRLIIEST